MMALKEEVKQADRLAKLKIAPKPAYGYGGQFGIEKDRMDKSAVDWNHIEVTEKHTSQKDYAKGFGGKYGVERDRQDKSSVGWDHKETVEKHSSQKDYSVGFGGKFGVQTDRQDKSALGWDHHEQSSHHPSQVDYSKGFGGKFGLQTDRVDSSSVGWNDVNQTESHPSQMKAPIFKPDGSLSNIRARFEQGINPNNVKDSSGLTVAQQRVLEEQTRWNAERKQQQQQREQQEDEEQSKGKSGSSDTVKSVSNNSVFTDTIKPTNNNTMHDHNWNKQVDSENNMKSLHSQEFKTFVESNQFNNDKYNQIPCEGLPCGAVGCFPQCVSYPLPVLHPDFFLHWDLVHDNPVASDDQVPEMFTVTALYDYEAAENDELTFKAGEIITEVEKIDAGWWKGVCRNKVGLFPANYVKLE
ncbi:unnamed protein product [Schistosoma curassoni]|uniref:SH3 domain-containing protein n=1 Tax=Schistosoma curassoni TaxID=6186 RepID=A0A183JYQ8_9TREM|nr:unnamed protein product [Schistosoma curassoni]